jgi:hypothetical protein
MGLMVLDRAHAADDLLDLDLATLCSCACGSASHDADTGCLASGCPCPARGLRSLAGEGLEDDAEFEAEVVLVTAALWAARARQLRLLEDRADAIAKDPTRAPRSNRPRLMKPTPPKAPAEPKAPRTGPTKAATPRSGKIVRKVAPSSPLPAEHSRAAWQDETEELLEAAGVLS